MTVPSATGSRATAPRHGPLRAAALGSAVALVLTCAVAETGEAAEPPGPAGTADPGGSAGTAGPGASAGPDAAAEPAEPAGAARGWRRPATLLDPAPGALLVPDADRPPGAASAPAAAAPPANSSAAPAASPTAEAADRATESADPSSARAADGAAGPQSATGAAGPLAPGAMLPLGVAQRSQARTVAGALAGYAERLERAEARRVSAAKRWRVGKVPLRPPSPPARKPELVTEPGQIAGKGLPPVITRVPTEDKVVFLTIDDGAEKDPELLKLMRELEIPYSAFLTDYVARDDYGYFRRMRADGAGIHNHSVSHREMPRLSYAEQRKEICTQQDVLEKEIGERPTLFRPPYGAYNRDTLRAAAACGIEAVPLWTEEAFADRMEWSRADRKLHPGDIVLTHFRGKEQWKGTMADMVRVVVRTATEQGFAIARLEDYL